MPYAFVQDQSDGTLADYDRVTQELGDEAPSGLIVHVAGAGPGGSGVRIIDVWESKEDFDRFMEERLMPALQRAGIPMTEDGFQMDPMDVHKIMRG